MTGLSSLIPPWVKIAAVAAVIGIIILCIYQWRADIKTLAYNEIFKEQVEDHLAKEKKKFEDFKSVTESNQRNLLNQLAEQKKLTERFKAADEEFKKQGFKNNPADPAVNFTLDQIRQMENAKRQGAAKETK